MTSRTGPRARVVPRVKSGGVHDTHGSRWDLFRRACVCLRY